VFSPRPENDREDDCPILYRLEGAPAVSENPFSDVSDGKYYTSAAAWAAENGIVGGYGGGLFGPEDSITREQFAQIMYNYWSYKGNDVSAETDLSTYTDSAKISGWALNALQWANAEGLINGRTETTLVPQGTATRAESAAILHRLLQ
jgi:hypothetical protein